jgi:hypothetical protein
LLAGFQADVAWQTEHCEDVVKWSAFLGVHLLPAKTWQLEQTVAPVWFIVPGTHEPPILWQVAHFTSVIDATVCAFNGSVGVPLALVPLWQVVQSVAEVTP